MNETGKIDQDDILRARTVLLASGHRTAREEVDAYRVLSRVSPASYLPLLVGALHRLTYDMVSRRRHPDALALFEEAVAAARAVDAAEPGRADLLYTALDRCQRASYAEGRRAEGLALCAEMLAIGRAQAEPSGGSPVRGLREWAAGLSAAGRYAEAADALAELLAAIRPEGHSNGEAIMPFLEWIAALDGAGRSAEALAAFETLVGMVPVQAANDRGPLVCPVSSLVGYARMLDAHRRGERAAAVRQEALAVLTELAPTGKPRTWSAQPGSFWAALLSLSGADGERLTSAVPLNLGPLREEVDALAARAAGDPGRHLAELVRLQRVLTVRSAVLWVSRTHMFAERVRPLFDEGVALARQLSRHDPVDGDAALAEALLDRSTFLTAVGEFGAALDDFRQALTRLGELD